MAIKRITIKGAPLRDEDVATGAITPGHLLQFAAAGCAVHATAAGNAAPAFALEREMTGDGIDVAYAANDTVLIGFFRSGDMVNALVAAAAAAIVRGDFLESAGDGTLRKLTAAAATSQASRESVVAMAEEAVDNSGGGAPARIKVRIL